MSQIKDNNLLIKKYITCITVRFVVKAENQNKCILRRFCSTREFFVSSLGNIGSLVLPTPSDTKVFIFGAVHKRRPCSRGGQAFWTLHTKFFFLHTKFREGGQKCQKNKNVFYEQPPIIGRRRV